jgi:hypothetical protein
MFEGYASRAGVFRYRDQAGVITAELRPASEVGRADSLATLARKPVTNTHPNVPVTAENADRFSVGALDGEVNWESDFEDGFIKVRGIVQRKDAVDAVDAGRQELSCGYTCDLDETPGQWTDSLGAVHEYDAIQRNITYNHLALVDKGRAGSQARLRVDAAMVDDDTEQTPQPKQSGQAGAKMKIRIDGQEYDITEEAAIKRALDAQQKRNDEAAAKLAEAEANAQAAQAATVEAVAKADAATAQLATVTAERDVLKLDADKAPPITDAAERMAWHTERMELSKRADALAIEVEAEASNDEIKRAIVLSRFDAEDLPTQAHIDAAFSLMSKDTAAPAPTTTRADSQQQEPSGVVAAEDAYHAQFR